MSTDPPHWDAGAYALGALTPADAAAFEAHLIRCDACADEVEALLPVVGMMGQVDADEIVATHNVMPRPRTVRPSNAPPPVEAPRTPPARAAPQRPAASRRTTSTRPVSGRVELRPPVDAPDPVRPVRAARPRPSASRPPLPPPPLITPTPVSSAPMSSVPMSAAPMSSVPMSSIPMSSVPMSSVPMSSVPMSAAPVSSRPSSSIRPTAAPRRGPMGPASMGPASAGRPSAPGRRRSAMDTVSALHRRVRQAPRHMNLRGSGRGRLVMVAAALLVFVISLAFVVGTQVSNPGADLPSAGSTTHLEGTNPANGVHAVLNVAVVPWGSQVQLSLGGVHGPLRCDLVAIGVDSTSTLVASWIVYEPGYGIPEEPELLTIQASTAARLADTSRFDIRQITPDGRATTLLTMPV